MFDKIVFISDHGATIKLKDGEKVTMNLMNLHIVFEDATKKVMGEVNDVNGDTVTASFLGEIVNGRFLGGTIRKPRLDATIRVINDEEILLITGKDEKGYMALGNTPFYEGKPVYLDVNNFFSGHFAIMGNSGSGKSCGISRLFQNMFHDTRLNPCNANIIMIDSSGEYYNAFNNLHSINPSYHYRFITTNDKDSRNEKLRIPIYLLNEADLALLLQCTSHSQLPIVERMRKLALVFSQKDMDANNYKNHLIAKAIMTILYTNESGPNKRNEIFSVLASCSTPQFNLEAVVQGLGYTRKFRECFLIDNSGNFTESVLITEYISSFIDDELDAYEPSSGVFYTLDTLEKALNFTLISEGWLRNKNTYGDAVTLKVRLHSLIVSNNAKFFDVKNFMSVEEYLRSLVNGDGTKYQFVNINLDDVDDDFAKVITKIYSRLIFDYSKGLTERASNPFHLVIEEAHRYIQNDNDRFLIGYNIFERIAKEGRKYGVILGIITQRPVELSDTVISQCSNFLIFKMNHPVDVDYIRKMVPNISDEIIEKQKTLQSGTCLGFGSAFKIPMIVRMEMPDPAPWSGNCDVVSFWGGGSALGTMVAPNDNSVGVAEPIPNSVFSPLNDIEAPTGMNNDDNPGDSLVKMSDTADDSGMHAGAFGLVEIPKAPEVTAAEEVKMPTTDTGVSLINLNGDSGSIVPNNVEHSSVPNSEPLVVPGSEQNISIVNFNNAPTGAAPVDMDMGTPSLVSFNTGSVPTNNVQPSMEQPSNPANSLVSFNTPAGGNNNPTPPANNVMSAPAVAQGNSSVFPAAVGNKPATSGTSAVVMAAPEVNTNLFENTGTGDEEDDSTGGGVSFVNTEPSSLSGMATPQDNSFASPSLVDLNAGPNANSGGLVNFNNHMPPMEPLTPSTGNPPANDNFNNNELPNMNNNLGSASFNPMDEINNIDNRSQGNDGFAPPTGMSFGGDSTPPSAPDNMQFNSGPNLVSFVNN